jgi:hypothetical protein
MIQPPSSARSANPTGATVAGQMKSPPANSSSCAGSGNSVAARTACDAPKVYIHAVDGQPRAIAETTRS